MNTTKALGFPKLALSLASCIFILSIHVVGEKGDTITALMTAKDLPPDTGFVPPTGKAAKGKVNMVFTDAGIKTTKFDKFTGYSWTADFPSDTFKFSRIALASSKLPGNAIFFNVTTDNAPEFFKYGNWTLYNEIGQALRANGLDETALLDNSTYALTILDEENKTALGGTLLSRTILVYGNGSLGDQTGTESELVSDLLYVVTVDNSTTGFDKGFTNGYTPGNGTGVALFQELPSGGYLWTLDVEFVKHPKSLELRYFVDLGYQPLVATLKPSAAWPSYVQGGSTSFEGNLTKEALDAGLANLGINWTTTNFNTTPSVYMLNFNERDNSTILGFMYYALEAPQPQPVIKGSAVRSSAVAVSFIATFLVVALI